MKIIWYHSNIIEFGGVETLTYNFCSRFSDKYDITLLYKECHINQLKRLSKIVKIEKYDEKKDYKADICVCNSSWGGYPEQVNAKEYWQIIHANYKELEKINYKYLAWHKTTRHFAVSKSTKKVFESMYPYKAELLYNILGKTIPTRHILRLVSATRLSNEKGYHRMLKLGQELKKRNIKFEWIVFTDIELYGIEKPDMEEFIFLKPRYDIYDYIKSADYGVQLSNTEGYSYTVNEFLQYGTPMLVTNFDSAKESVIDGENGYILPFELFESDKNWDYYIDKIINKIPKDFVYKEKCTEEDWIKLLGKPTKQKPIINQEILVEIEAIKEYYDIETKETKKRGSIWTTSIERTTHLVSLDLVKIRRTL